MTPERRVTKEVSSMFVLDIFWFVVQEGGTQQSMTIWLSWGGKDRTLRLLVRIPERKMLQGEGTSETCMGVPLSIWPNTKLHMCHDKTPQAWEIQLRGSSELNGDCRSHTMLKMQDFQPPMLERPCWPSWAFNWDPGKGTVQEKKTWALQ